MKPQTTLYPGRYMRGDTLYIAVIKKHLRSYTKRSKYLLIVLRNSTVRSCGAFRDDNSFRGTKQTTENYIQGGVCGDTSCSVLCLYGSKRKGNEQQTKKVKLSQARPSNNVTETQ